MTMKGLKSFRDRIKTDRVISFGQHVPKKQRKPKLVHGWDDVRQEPGWALPIRW